MNWLNFKCKKYVSTPLPSDPIRFPFGSEDMIQSTDPSQENMSAKDQRDIFQEEPGSAPVVDKRTNDSGKSKDKVFPRIDPNTSVWGEGKTNE